jgi:hypothetical protein
MDTRALELLTTGSQSDAHQILTEFCQKVFLVRECFIAYRETYNFIAGIKMITFIVMYFRMLNALHLKIFPAWKKER